MKLSMHLDENDVKKMPQLKIQKLQMILDFLYCGILTLDHQGLILAFNTSAEIILNIKRNTIIGKYIQDVESLQEVASVISQNNGMGRHKVEINEAKIIVNLNKMIENGKSVGVVAILHKSSSAECIDQELNVTESLLKEINIFIESSHDGFLITDNKGKVIRVNAAFERVFSVSRKDVLGKTAQELVKTGVYGKSAALETLRTSQTCTVIMENKGRKIMATGTPVFNLQGNLTSVVVNVRDITELENLKLQLEYQQKLNEKYSYEIKEMRKRQENFPDIIMHSKEMHQVMDMVCTVSEVDSTVLVTGESGVGKEIVTHQIHKLSRRNKGPFIKINCGAIPYTLFESELFGYEPGAFTGAKSRGKMGFFELAHEGTLFLDEIGELNVDMQVKLLRVIQEKEVTRIGGEKSIKIDVRIITATNRDLKKMMEKGEFRQDLFYRLNVLNIQIPPLRERREDIAPLILNFLEKFNKKYKKKKVFTNEAVRVLTEYDWPGNIRELENLVENLVILVKQDEITTQHLPENLFSSTLCDDKIIVKGIIPLKKAIEIVESQIVNNAKKKCDTTRQMAKVLGVNQSTVIRKLKQYTQH